jgi:uroporphyrinogen-III synthase
MSVTDHSSPSRVILTRAATWNSGWAAQLAVSGIAVKELPLIRYTQLDVQLDPASYDWILFTSPQGVRAFYAAGFTAAGVAASGVSVGVLAAGTAAALAESGGADDLGIRVKDGAELAAEFCKRVSPPATILLPGAAERLDQPARTLAANGFSVTEIALYKTDSVPAGDLPADPVQPGDILFFASPSAVKSFSDAYTVRPPAAAIGETTAAAAREAGFNPVVAKRPDLAALCAAAGLYLVQEEK